MPPIQKVYKYDSNGKFVREFESIMQTVFIEKISKPRLIEILKGERKHNKKIVYTTKYYIKLPEDMLPKTKKVYRYDLNGNYIDEFDNKNLAIKKFNLPSVFHTYFKNKKEGVYCGGFLWSINKVDSLKPYKKRTNDFKKIKVAQYDSNGKFIKVFDGSIDAAKELNVSNCTINAICKGRNKFTKDRKFTFRYFDGSTKNISL